MLFRKISEEEKNVFGAKITSLVPDAVRSNIEPRELMLRWLSTFAPDMSYRDAKDYCLPRRRYKNNLWHAFSFQLADCLVGEDAEEAYKGFEGECFILSEETEEIYTVGDGSILTISILQNLGGVTVFTKDFSKTFTVTGKDETGPYYKEAVV